MDRCFIAMEIILLLLNTTSKSRPASLRVLLWMVQWCPAYMARLSYAELESQLLVFICVFGQVM